MTPTEIKVLLVSYLDDVEVPDELIEEFLGHLERAFMEGYAEGERDAELRAAEDWNV